MTHLNNHRQIVEVLKWQLKHSANPTPKASALKALEEMIELAFEAGASVDDVARVTAQECDKAHVRGYAYPEAADKQGMYVEFGDVIACLTCFGYHANIGGIEAFDSALRRIQEREARGEWVRGEDHILRRPRVVEQPNPQVRSSVHIDERPPNDDVA